MAIVQRLVTRQRGTLRLRNRTPLPGFEVTIDFPPMKGGARFDG
jgi:two-component system osmolarity sensor histidine kinase EnvZ